MVFSNGQNKITTTTPSAFIKGMDASGARNDIAFFVVANDDNGHVQPVVKLLNEYRAAGAPVEVHIFARGGHAFNMGYRTPLATLKHWPDRMAEWLADNEWLKPREASKDAAQK